MPEKSPLENAALQAISIFASQSANVKLKGGISGRITVILACGLAVLLVTAISAAFSPHPAVLITIAVLDTLVTAGGVGAVFWYGDRHPIVSTLEGLEGAVYDTLQKQGMKGQPTLNTSEPELDPSTPLAPIDPNKLDTPDAEVKQLANDAKGGDNV